MKKELTKEVISEDDAKADERNSTVLNGNPSIVPDIDKLAELSKLYITDEERKSIENTISARFSFIKVLEELKTNEEIDVRYSSSSASTAELKNVLREDESPLSFDREEMLRNAPLRDEQFIIVPRVLE